MFSVYNEDEDYEFNARYDYIREAYAATVDNFMDDFSNDEESCSFQDTPVGDEKAPKIETYGTWEIPF